MAKSKRCSKCGKTKPVSEFYKQQGSKDGLRSQCKKCRKKYRKTKKGKLVHQRGAARQRTKYPERIKARHAVSHAIRDGKKPSPKIYTCLICFKKPAQQYHHHLGYSPEHQLDVIAVCKKCHKKLDSR